MERGIQVFPKSDIPDPAQEYKKMLGSTEDDVFFRDPDDLVAVHDPGEQPFDYYVGTPKFQKLVADIEHDGQNVPCLLQHTTDGDIIIDGRHRRDACKKLGKQVKCTYKQYHEDTPEKEKARVILTRCQSHELNRQELSHKEKARMYKQMKDSYITLGYRDPVARVAGTSPDKLKTVSRHIQVAELTDALLDMIVDKQIEFMAGYEISFFRDKSHFDCLHDFLADHPKVKVKKKAAEELRNLEAVTPLTYQLLDSFFFPQKLDTPTSPSTVNAITLKCSELPFDTDGLTKEEIKQKVLEILGTSTQNIQRKREC